MLRLVSLPGLTLALSALLSAPPLHAQTAADWRGAWIADDGNQVLYLVLRNDKVSGFYCSACYEPANLAFVDDGAVSAAALHFNLYHSPAVDQPDARVEQVEARLDANELVLTIQGAASAPSTLRLHRAPSPVKAPPVAGPPPNPPQSNTPRPMPAAAATITADKVLGLWLSGAGPTKQYFIFKRHKDGIRGMVCGPCNSARDFAPLENISINGTNLHFDIVHEDNGIGFEEHGPFSNVTDAQISMNEMRMTTVTSFDPQGRKFEMTLLGPVQYMPARQP